MPAIVREGATAPDSEVTPPRLWPADDCCRRRPGDLEKDVNADHADDRAEEDTRCARERELGARVSPGVHPEATLTVAVWTPHLCA
eukprot:5226260-Heterocapsa_arctica.AAC.1